MRVKITKNHLKELIRQSIKEIDFDSEEDFKKYNAKHKMRKTTKVNIAGKDTTAGKADSLSKGDVGGPSYSNVPKGVKSSDDLKGKKASSFTDKYGREPEDMTDLVPGAGDPGDVGIGDLPDPSTRSGKPAKGTIDTTQIDDAMTAPTDADGNPEYDDGTIDDIIGDLKSAGGFESHIKLLDGAKGDGWKINGILHAVKGENGKRKADKALASKDFGPDQMEDTFKDIKDYATHMGYEDVLDDFTMEIDDIIADEDVDTFKSYAEELLDPDVKEKDMGKNLAQMDYDDEDSPESYYDDNTPTPKQINILNKLAINGGYKHG